MRKLLCLLLLLTLTGCATAEPPPAVEVMAPAEAPPVLSLGLAATAHLQRSMHATENFPGRVQLEVTVAAVLVDEAGVIRRCTIDGVRATVPFDQEGVPLLYTGTVFPSKCALGEDYGMARASSLGQEWDAQAARLAADSIGKTAAQLLGGDVTASVTINPADALYAVAEAAENAAVCTAGETDPLTLTCAAVLTEAAAPTAEGSGCIVLRCAATVEAGGAERTCALAAHVPVTAQGRLACATDTGLSPLSEVLRPVRFAEEDRQLLGQS